MKKLIPILLLSFCHRLVFAQFNDTTHYHANLNTTGSINRADGDNSYLLNNVFNFGIKEKSITLNSSNNWVYGKQNNTETNNDFSSSLFINLFKTFPHFYYWGLLNYNTSYSLKINNQLLAGLGVAYSVVDQKNIYINFSDGVLFDQSDLLVNEVYHTYRNSFRFVFHFSFNDVVVVDGSNFLQNSFSRSNDYIIKSIITASFRLRKWISLTTAFNYNKMNITQSQNLLLTYGLTLDKYF
ncbi:MAG: hypothetical protein JWR67_2391 [Mucilaginibacter sp.]|nr:hypothetical protein [Mucilaginibacter sp.]